MCRLEMGLEEEEDGSERSTSRKARPEVITFTEEETAQLAKIPPQESATVSEQVLVQSAAEKDRISEMKDRQAELEAEPKHANCCSYCPKSFKKPSDLVRCGGQWLWGGGLCRASLLPGLCRLNPVPRGAPCFLHLRSGLGHVRGSPQASPVR